MIETTIIAISAISEIAEVVSFTWKITPRSSAIFPSISMKVGPPAIAKPPSIVDGWFSAKKDGKTTFEDKQQYYYTTFYVKLQYFH